MPRLAGVNLLGGFLAAVAIYAVGALWFGALFQELWVSANGYTDEQLTQNFNPAIVFGGGAVIPIILAFAIGWLLKATNTTGLMPSVVFAAKLALFIATPILAYSFVYNVYHSTTDLMLDVSHSLFGFMLGAAVLSLFD
ncbi:MAG: DUF1761 domain-containing protein [Pseudomonadota bacterium]